MFNQGYVGITNNTQVRWNDHNKRPSNAHIERAIKKYGWDSMVKEVVLIANRAYCLDIELKLRPKNNIGWNVVLGGGNPPSSLGKKFIRSEEFKAKMSASKNGHKHTKEVEELVTKNLLIYGIPTRFKKGNIPEVNTIKSTCPYCNKNGTGMVMRRWHMDNCKYKGALN